MAHHTHDRRSIAARSSPFFQGVSRFLARIGVSPNAISVSSVFFAVGASVGLILTAQSPNNRLLWLTIAMCIPLRLIANMLDGMVAVDSGKLSNVGELFNEVPDRVSDVLIFVSAGYAYGSTPSLGYGLAIIALFIPYLRALGNSMDVTQLFIGPMAKSHRMFALAGICLYNAIAPASLQVSTLLMWGLAVIGFGGVITIFRRLQKIVAAVNS